MVQEKEAALASQQAEIAALTQRVVALENGAAPAHQPVGLPWLLLAGLALLNLGGLAGFALARARRGGPLRGAGGTAPGDLA